MDTLDGMKTVVAVVETGSFTAAGDRLGISKALVSKYIGEVEDALGVRLFNRSTRRLAITEAGQNYYQRVIPLLEEYGELIDSVAGEQSKPRGLLRVSTPTTFGEFRLAPLLPAFLSRFPDLNVELVISDRSIDMLQEGIDVRIRIGGLDDSNLVARQINRFPLIMCASPDYLNARGVPTNARELETHDIVIDSNFRIGKHWPLIAEDGSSDVAHVTSRVAANSPQAVKEVVVNGGGIGLIPSFVAEKELADASLVPIMENYKTMEFSMFAIYPHRRYVAKKVRTFVDFLYEHFGNH